MAFEAAWSEYEVMWSPQCRQSPGIDVKILHLSTWDVSGGASRATFCLHRGLQDLGVSSQMIVQHKSSSDASVQRAPTSTYESALARLAPGLDRLPLKLYSRRAEAPWGIGWLPDTVSRQIAAQGADIIHFHWIGDGFVPISAFERIKVPVVWSFHDPWPFTGGCNYPGSCRKYEESCGACPQLGSTRTWDLSRWVWHRKRKHLQSLNLTAVTQSRWLWRCAQQSSLFRDRPVEMIPYGLDTKIFSPLNRGFSRQALNLPQDKKIICMGAMKSTTDPRKGFAHLARAARMLASRGWGERALLLVFGADDTSELTDFGLETRLMGMLHDDYSLALIYSAADVFVAPSIEEAFGLTVLEALACGTPCVGFDVGGIPDMIEHGRTGYLVPTISGEELAEGIAWVLQDHGRLADLSVNARTKVEREFASRLYAQRYLDLYAQILGSNDIRAGI